MFFALLFAKCSPHTHTHTHSTPRRTEVGATTTAAGRRGPGQRRQTRFVVRVFCSFCCRSKHVRCATPLLFCQWNHSVTIDVDVDVGVLFLFFPPKRAPPISYCSRSGTIAGRSMLMLMSIAVCFYLLLFSLRCLRRSTSYTGASLIFVVISLSARTRCVFCVYLADVTHLFLLLVPHPVSGSFVEEEGRQEHQAWGRRRFEELVDQGSQRHRGCQRRIPSRGW